MSGCFSPVRMNSFIHRWHTQSSSLAHPFWRSSMDSQQHSALSDVMEELTCSWVAPAFLLLIAELQQGTESVGLNPHHPPLWMRRLLLPPFTSPNHRIKKIFFSMSWLRDISKYPYSQDCKKVNSTQLDKNRFKMKCGRTGLWKLSAEEFGSLDSWRNLRKFWNAVIGHCCLLNCTVFSQHSKVFLYKNDVFSFLLMLGSFFWQGSFTPTLNYKLQVSLKMWVNLCPLLWKKFLESYLLPEFQQRCRSYLQGIFSSSGMVFLIYTYLQH